MRRICIGNDLEGPIRVELCSWNSLDGLIHIDDDDDDDDDDDNCEIKISLI